MEKLFILKIGGSIATYKDNTEHTVREDTLRKVFAVLAELYKKADFKLIIVHGAGGHVHHLAHMYELKGGTQGDRQKEAGAIHTQEAVAQLHKEIMKIGLDSKLPLQSFPTHDVITQNNRKIVECDIHDIQESLTDGRIPVLYGDMVNDTSLGMSICSGDAVSAHLTTLLPVTHKFFATDVDGIYTSDPHTDLEATLVEQLSLANIEKEIILSGSHNKDTTGGLEGKIKECTDLFDTSTTLQEIHIFNGLSSENYRAVLLNIELPHTRIQK